MRKAKSFSTLSLVFTSGLTSAPFSITSRYIVSESSRSSRIPWQSTDNKNLMTGPKGKTFNVPPGGAEWKIEDLPIFFLQCSTNFLQSENVFELGGITITLVHSQNNTAFFLEIKKIFYSFYHNIFWFHSAF